MAISEDIKVEGVTACASPPSSSYRYTIELKNDTMSIWMEDQASKKQWYKGDMSKDDFVTTANVMPNALMIDYVKDSLNCELSHFSDVQRKIIPLKGGGLRLTMAMTIAFLRSKWVAKYSFDLDPVSVERIDILESKLRDQQDELKKLRGYVDGGQCESPAFVQLESSSKVGSTLYWHEIESDESILVMKNGEVKVRRAGVYSIGAAVNSSPTSYNEPVELMKNGECIQRNYSMHGNGCSSTYLTFITRLKEDDTIAVKCVSDLAPTPSAVPVGRKRRGSTICEKVFAEQCPSTTPSYLSVVRLGK